MNTTWPDRLGIGDRIRFDGRACTVTELYGRRLTVTDTFGDAQRVDVAELLLSHGFALLELKHPPDGSRPKPTGDTMNRARWWELHIVEVLTGLPPTAPPDTRPHPAYDPVLHTLGEREAAKAEELTRQGVRGASARSIQRKRQRYEVEGLAGLTDGRAERREEIGARWDPRILSAIRQAARPGVDGRKLSVEEVRRRVSRIFESETETGQGKLALPSRSAFHRLYTEMETAGLLAGSARWPGRQVVLESVLLPQLPGQGHHTNGDRRLLFAVDADTRVVLTAVVQEQTHPVDSASLLARMWLPGDLKAGWPSAQPATPSQISLVEALPPLVRPQTLLLDRSRGPHLRGLTEVCRRHEVQIQRSGNALPQVRHFIERMGVHLGRRFADYLCSAAGDAARTAGWPTVMLQELLDSWLLTVWPHEELPTEKGASTVLGGVPAGLRRYAGLIARTGWILTPPSPQAYVALLRSEHRRVRASGVYVQGRRFDGPGLDKLRSATPSSRKSPACQVRYDPYDTRRVWVRTPDQRWLAVPAATPAPAPPLPRSEAPTNPAVRSAPRASPSSGFIIADTFSPPALIPTQASPQPPPADAPDDVRVTYHAQLPLHTPDVVAAIQRAEELILLNQHATGARHGLLVCGEPGTGKSTVLQELARRHTTRARTRYEPDNIPAVHVALPPLATPRMFLVELARSTGAPFHARATTADLTHRVHNHLLATGTGLVLVDDLNFRYNKPSSTVLMAETMNYLCDQVPATFVFAGRLPATPEMHSRLLPLTLRRLPPGPTWLEVVAQAEKALRLRNHPPGALPDLVDHLHELTAGTALRLGYLVRSGAIRAIRDGTERITASLLDDLSAPWQRADGEPCMDNYNGTT
ncbi:AAA family ATPase [Streptomyces sp. NPDC088350]|uniref:AAA family ATPase n=1 Tax=Streptomyces sp. NPDC088350 TaxID=3365854 RepID=UPI0037FE8D0F